MNTQRDQFTRERANRYETALASLIRADHFIIVQEFNPNRCSRARSVQLLIGYLKSLQLTASILLRTRWRASTTQLSNSAARIRVASTGRAAQTMLLLIVVDVIREIRVGRVHIAAVVERLID